MNQIKDLINFVRELPRRLAWFEDFQSSDSNSLRPLCPTRWTMRISSIQLVIANYSELLQFLEVMSESEKGDAGAKSSGFLKQLQAFSMFFSLKLLIQVFSKTESTAQSLQSPKLSLTQAQAMVDTLSNVLNSARDERKFSEMWIQVVGEADSLEIDKPVLPRTKRPSRRIDDGNAQPHQDVSCEDMYRRIYFFAVDAALVCLNDRFQSPAFNFSRDIEAAIIHGINLNTVPGVLYTLKQHYGDDIDDSRLRLHLSMLGDACRNTSSPAVTVTSINDVVHLFQTKPEWMKLFPEVVKLIKLFLTIPVTTCTAERSFSCLRRLKTYLRSVVSQKRLIHMAVLHCHRDRADEINLEELCNGFIQKNELRASTFALF